MGLPQSLILLHRLHDILINVEFLYGPQLPVNISNYNKHDTLLKKSVAKNTILKILNSFSELYNNAIRVLELD